MWTVPFHIANTIYVAFFVLVACSRLSVSGDDRKSERATSGTLLVARPLFRSSPPTESLEQAIVLVISFIFSSLLVDQQDCQEQEPPRNLDNFQSEIIPSERHAHQTDLYWILAIPWGTSCRSSGHEAAHNPIFALPPASIRSTVCAARVCAVRVELEREREGEAWNHVLFPLLVF